MTIKDFDKIYVLHLAERKDRYENLIKEFGRVNLLNDIDIWWTCKRPISIICGNSIQSLHTDDYDHIQKYKNPTIYGGVFNCAFEHYTIIKTSYERGLNHILIFEDDISFVNDREYFDKCLEQVSPDMPICKLYYTDGPNDICNNFNNQIFEPIINYGISSTAAYCLNREGMKTMIESYDFKFDVADKAFMNIDNYEKLFINKYKILYINDTNSDIFN